MAKNKQKQEDSFELPPPPEVSPADAAALRRLAAAGDQGGADQDQDWDPNMGTTEDAPGEKKKPGRPKKDKEPPKPRAARKAIEIRSGAIKKDIFCHFNYDHNLAPTITNDILIKSEVPVHDDMRVAFKQLVPHLAMVFQRLTLDEINGIDPDNQEDASLVILRKFDVDAFYLDKYDDEECVVLIGSEILPTGSASLTTPPIQFIGSRYEHAASLRTAIDDVLFEIEEYLHGRKRADDKQIKMDF